MNFLHQNPISLVIFWRGSNFFNWVDAALALYRPLGYPFVPLFFSHLLSMGGHWPSSSLSTGSVVSLRRDWAIFCHAGSGRVGRVWSAREKSFKILHRGRELNPGHKEDRQWAIMIDLFHFFPPFLSISFYFLRCYKTSWNQNTFHPGIKYVISIRQFFSVDVQRNVKFTW